LTDFRRLFGGPPRPYVDAVFWRGTLQQPRVSLIDTGADGTQVPLKVVENLGFKRPLRRKPVTNADGRDTWLGVYLVDVELLGTRFRDIEVTAANMDIPLMGWDILRYFHLRMDGLSRAFSLTLIVAP
jgi:predicted aspartyl protease